jgi:hypothetical protein
VDAILIPGGGVRAGGELPPWVANRLDRAVERRGEASLIVLSAGTTHRPPPLDEYGYPLFEATAGARYLLSRGVPQQRILEETASYDTIGNAYFSLVIHVVPRNFRQLLVITSAFHMPRTQAIFKWIYGLGGISGLSFEAVPDAGMDDAVLQFRREKEAASLAVLNGLQGKLNTLAGLHEWLFTEHAAYAAGRQFRPSSAGIMATY